MNKDDVIDIDNNEGWIHISLLNNKRFGIITRTQSDYIDIPQRSKHRLCNKGEFNLVVCEVQFGQLLEEDDIIRYEDDFGRE